MKNKLIKRLSALRTHIEDAKLDGLYICGVANVSYLTGKKGNDCALFVTSDEAYILTDFRYREMALELEGVYDFVETKADRAGVDFLASHKANTIGVERKLLSLDSYLEFMERMPQKRIEPVDGLVEALRIVKDEEELAATKKACAIADRCFTHMLDFLKPGITEKAAALEIEYFMKKNGADDLSFDTICVSGAKTSYPHGIPGDKLIEVGDFVTMDYGCKVDGYCSDMTRTVAIGKATDEMKAVYNTVLQAQLAACDGIKAGITGVYGDSIARSIINANGYGDYFGHGLGHGTGLEIHEAPRLSPSYSGVVPEGSIVSIEPGIYIPKKFGVRIEDLATVTSFGIINNVVSPKELIII